ncbi:MAG: hypothetical protein NTW30_01350 [Candidatus Aenigmarchaeota archaeon]|nr:hypothetical protein [Candidatus Aenigmarchaeota archaeon]
MNSLKKDWEEDLKSRVKKLRERAEKKPEPKKIPIEPEKYVVTEKIKEKPDVVEKDQYLEIKEEDIRIEKKPEVSVKIEKENHYAVIKPIIDEIKEQTKQELYEEKIKEEKILEEKKIEKTEVPKEKIVNLIDGIGTTIDKLIDIINKRGSVTTIDLSKELEVSVEMIEIWAKILEDRGLINIEYPLIGPSKLRKKEWKKES